MVRTQRQDVEGLVRLGKRPDLHRFLGIEHEAGVKRLGMCVIEEISGYAE